MKSNGKGFPQGRTGIISIDGSGATLGQNQQKSGRVNRSILGMGSVVSEGRGVIPEDRNTTVDLGTSVHTGIATNRYYTLPGYRSSRISNAGPFPDSGCPFRRLGTTESLPERTTAIQARERLGVASNAVSWPFSVSPQLPCGLTQPEPSAWVDDSRTSPRNTFRSPQNIRATCSFPVVMRRR